MWLLAGRRDDLGVVADGRIPVAHKLGIELVAVLDGAGVGDLNIGAEAVKLDAVLGQEGLVLAEALDEVALGHALLAAAGRLGRDDAALDAGLDAVRAWLALIAADLALLAQDARVAPGHLHQIGDVRKGGGGGRRRRQWRWVLGEVRVRVCRVRGRGGGRRRARHRRGLSI